jgi:aminopeptidase C
VANSGIDADAVQLSFLGTKTRRSKVQSFNVTMDIPDDVAQRLREAHEVWIDYSLGDLKRKREGLRHLGL